jgi:hypothetical protein
MHDHLVFWLFPPQGLAESAVRARACMLKDVTEEAICVGHLELDEVPQYGEVERIARLGMEMAQGTGKYAGSGGSWRDPGLCLVAIAAESGDFPSRTLLAYEIAREVGHAMAEDDACRIPAAWIRTLSRRVVDLLSERPKLLPNHKPEQTPFKGDRVEDIWLSTRKPDAHLLAETLLPHIGEAVSKAHPRLDRDVRTALERVVRSRCMQSGPLHYAASLLAAGKADGHLADPQKLARVLHWGAACLGERGSMLAVAEYLLMEIERPDRITETEALYSLVHGWLHYGISHCRLGGIGPIRHVLRDMASAKVGLQRGPLAPEADSGVTHPPMLSGFNLAEEHAERTEDEESIGDLDEAKVSAPAGPMLVVIRGGMEGAAKAHRDMYAPLRAPLPLAVSKLPPEVVRATLTAEFPWLRPVVDMIVDDMWTRKALGDEAIRFRPLLLWGGAGIGKTTFARRVGELLGLPTLTIAAAGASTTLTLKGLSKGYQGAHPSLVVEHMLRTGTPNFLAVVDEIDKAAQGSHNGDVAQVLLDFLEPATSSRWLDECLAAEVDVSRVNWILTANDAGRIPGPLLSRCRAFQVQAPVPEHFDALFRSVLRHIAGETGCRPEMLPTFDDLDIEVLRRMFRKHPSVRSLRSKVERLIGLRAKALPANAVLN